MAVNEAIQFSIRGSRMNTLRNEIEELPWERITIEFVFSSLKE